MFYSRIKSDQDREEFTDAVRKIVMSIPPGRATSYGAVARAAGYPNRSRMVGRLMASDRMGLPAHRVVNGQGFLSAKKAFGPGKEMEERLLSEGIEVRHDQIVNWKSVFWDPLNEL